MSQTKLRSVLASVPDADETSARLVRERADHVLRPTGALARLDAVAVHMARWQARPRPAVEHPEVLVFAADHGVAAGGVSAYPADITASMLTAVTRGRATINALASVIGARVDVIDVGVGRPTGDIRVETALSADRFDDTVTTALDAVDRAAARGTDVLVLGELGIGNTTVAAALPTVLVDPDASLWVGRGTGVDDAGLERKLRSVEAARDRVAGLSDPLEILREIGGAELVAMAAAAVGARHRHIPVILDGYVATAAMLPVAASQPGALDHCLAGHVSAEPGHRRLLDHLAMTALLDLEMRLGEGSGALAAVPIVAMACAAVNDVPTFDEWFGSEAAP